MISAITEMPPNAHIALLRLRTGCVCCSTRQRTATLTKSIRSFTTTGAPGLLDTIEPAPELADSILAKTPVRTALCYERIPTFTSTARISAIR
jgi:hypothetical protein